MTTTTTVSVRPITPTIGAIVTGLDLRESLAPQTVREIRQAVLDHGILFLREQDITREDMAAFMSCFGTPCVDPFSVVTEQLPPEATVIDMTTLAYSRATAVWHIDSSLAPEPASFMSLRAIEIPPTGGDTCWSSMYAAYDALSEPLRDFLDGLSAVHSAYKVLPLMEGADYGYLQEGMRNVHPVIRVHPETGRKALFVNELWTERIVELSRDESQHLLGFLFGHVKSPAFSIRWQWQPNDVAFWDNRCLAHYAVNDYTEHRVMQKSLVAGDRPYGPR